MTMNHDKIRFSGNYNENGDVIPQTFAVKKLSVSDGDGGN